jgi:hypothetical protein
MPDHVRVAQSPGTDCPGTPRDFLPGGRSAAGVVPVSPWLALSKADCLLLALALHRAAVSARLCREGSE